MSSESNLSSCARECSEICEHVETFPYKMAFQPLVNLKEKKIYGYEALIRGINNESASTVLDTITDQNRYIFDQSCRVKAISTASRLGLDRRLNINFMPNAVYNPEACLRLTLQAAKKYKFPPHLITFEFTENEEIINHNHLKSIIETYSRHGIKTAIDDFGAGYSGLSLLAHFQPNYIKIDRELICDIDSLKPSKAIVSGLLMTAQSLDIEVVAEGVERIEELVILKDMGVNLFQGYLFAKPALERLIKEDEISWPEVS